MDRTGKVGCGRGVHTAHAQYYSMLISLKLPGSNTLCATHAKGTGHVLPSSPVSQLPVLTHPRNIPFFFFYFSLCESAPSDAHPSRVSLLPSQYKALPSSGDLCSATCNPLPLNCSYNLCHSKLANNAQPALLFLSVRKVISTEYRVPATNTSTPNAPCAILASHIFAIVSLTHSGLILQLPTHAFVVHFISDSPPFFSYFPKPYLARSILPANPRPSANHT